ncbi:MULTISPECIES: hypothetical protein [Bacillaceae]|uniref:Uncharacterized protein n=1 Tax=Evansella alkalicola TaxID=745819 RepID=A0ABS6JWU0_9BACI|nr:MULTISPECIES: hypothetical protein [Bacillaceae]MBU9722958.1 hypothetical protein [Bacillus alkalicola]
MLSQLLLVGLGFLVILYVSLELFMDSGEKFTLKKFKGALLFVSILFIIALVIYYTFVA